MDSSESCCVCHRIFPHGETVAVHSVAADVRAQLEASAGKIGEDDRVCRSDLFTARTRALLGRLERERGELTQMERDLADKATKHTSVAADIDADFNRDASLGQRAADTVARFGGSWVFVIGMVGVIGSWMLINQHNGQRAFDPYPFILLNLVLSCIAALQAPVLLMSANRQAELDRRKANQDFLVNLKAEIEVASLHDKLDHLLHVQWEQLLELQDLQIDMLESLVDRAAPPQDGSKDRG